MTEGAPLPIPEELRALQDEAAMTVADAVSELSGHSHIVKSLKTGEVIGLSTPTSNEAQKNVTRLQLERE